ERARLQRFERHVALLWLFELAHERAGRGGRDMRISTRCAFRQANPAAPPIGVAAKLSCLPLSLSVASRSRLASFGQVGGMRLLLGAVALAAGLNLTVRAIADEPEPPVSSPGYSGGSSQGRTGGGEFLPVPHRWRIG